MWRYLRDQTCVILDHCRSNHISTKFIKELFKEHKTYEDISNIIMIKFLVWQGFTVTLIKEFYRKNCISSYISKEYFEQIVSKALDQVTLFRKLVSLFLYLYMQLGET